MIKVETSTRPDPPRLFPPFKDGEPGINRGGTYTSMNSNKYGISLNLNHPKGPEVAWRLVQWADVVAQSYTPGTMDRWGLDYASVSARRPDIIYFSTSQFGQTGPWAGVRGYGPLLSAQSGFYHTTGWPDRSPAGPFGAYTDFISHRLGGLAILAALQHRRRTGQGQHIDLSQLEASLQFLAPSLLDFDTNGRVAGRVGNYSPHAVPHGVYPCRGDDRWVAIVAETDTQWEALCQAIGDSAELHVEQFATFQDRKAHERECDERLAEWTRERSPEEVMRILQSAGVPAGVVQSAADLLQDVQLHHRQHFMTLSHKEIGSHIYERFAIRSSQTSPRLDKAAPCLGEDNEFVYMQLLGMDPEEYTALSRDGAFL